MSNTYGTHDVNDTNDGQTRVLCRECYDPYPPARYRLGYMTCLSCGDKQAHAVTYCSAPINKSNYMLITNRADLAQLNPKRTT